MRMSFAVPRASAVTAVLLLGACSDDDSSTTTAEAGIQDTSTTSTEAADDSTPLATGEDVEIIESTGRWRLNIDAQEQDGEVTGEVRLDNIVVSLQCADTDTIDGEIRLGGEVTVDPDGESLPLTDGYVTVGDLVAVIVREYPAIADAVTFYASDSAGSCTELVQSVPYNLDGGFFLNVEDSEDIETGGENFNP
jgi:hypothetical protein